MRPLLRPLPHAARSLAAIGLFAFGAAVVAAAEDAGPPRTIPLASGLPRGARLALCGDSLTELRLYTRYVEAYLLACAGRGDISVFQFGWGGENADQFANRIARGDLDAFRPTAVSIAYGANDAGGQGWAPWMEGMWTGRVEHALDLLAARYPATATCTVICSPTWFQVAADGGNAATVTAINGTLERFLDLDLAIARQRGTAFADVQRRMRLVAAAAGDGFRFGGRDGVHGGPNGQLLIAHELLKALGADGQVATITIDLAGTATASAGHTVERTTADHGATRTIIASTRYPFCWGDDGAADGLASVRPFLSFDQELNRFTLVVRGAPAAGARVAWGPPDGPGEARDFTATELSAGVNLAAAFPRTPFDTAFAHLLTLIAARQDHERTMIKAARDATTPDTGWTTADVAKREELDAAVHAALVAVRHVITVTAR